MLRTTAFQKYTSIKGIPFPKGSTFNQLIITGPPCSGKSTLIKRLGGWFEEGYLDLTFESWWKNKIFFTRPRELHLGLPFHEFDKPLAIFQPAWLANPQPIAFERVLLPPIKLYFWEIDWRKKFIFEFLIPSAETILQRRQIRAEQHTHHVDLPPLSLEMIQYQIRVYQEMALFFKDNGFSAHIREDLDGLPLRILGRKKS